jgi:hypothetical protein
MFTDALRREKGIEDIGLHLWGNSRPAVTDFDHNIVVLAESSHPKFAPARHGIDRVLDDIGPDLVQLGSRRVNQKRDRFIRAL